ncbi:hypothetical protein BSM4216_1810 [Bacillus smithii]|nr:hypothetical protein BSM4216_1810 [Bacillus smithii]
MVIMEHFAQMSLDEPASNDTKGVYSRLLKLSSCTFRWKE